MKRLRLSRLLRAGATALAFACAACSAMGLGEYEPAPCKAHRACEQLNASLPADACERYYCVGSGHGCELRATDLDGDEHPDMNACQDELEQSELDCDDLDPDRYPGRDEDCNGRDDDCDGFIDEALEMTGVGQRVSIDPGVVDLAQTELEDRLQLLALTRKVGSGGRFETTRVVITDDGPGDSGRWFEDDLACEQAEGACNFAQLALSASSGLVVAAAIHRGRCGAGQLRVGVGDRDALGAALAAPPSASNVAVGIDVDPETGCTLVGRCPGASEPLLAVLPEGEDSPRQALALFRSNDAGGEDSCETPDGARLMGLGLLIDGSERSPFLTASAGGRAVPLGRELATGRPALLALDAGYLIAYPARTGLELASVPPLSDGDTAPASASWTTLELPGAQAPALAGLGLAYRSGAAGAEASVRFSQLTLDSGDLPHIQTKDSMFKLPAETEIFAGPVLAYAAKGFVAEDSSGPKGGWLMMWVEQASDERALKVARIADKEQHVLAEPYELARGDELAHPFVYVTHDGADGASLHYGFVDGGELHLNRLECQR